MKFLRSGPHSNLALLVTAKISCWNKLSFGKEFLARAYVYSVCIRRAGGMNPHLKKHRISKFATPRVYPFPLSIDIPGKKYELTMGEGMMLQITCEGPKNKEAPGRVTMCYSRGKGSDSESLTFYWSLWFSALLPSV
jgi:hypothetical protein